MRRAAWMLAAAAGAVVGATSVHQGPQAVLPGGVLLPALRLTRGPSFSVAAAPPPHAAVSASERVLWNFTEPGATVDEWVESSDGTAREAGMSTGAFKLQKTARFQRAVLFSLLNPQPNGAGFVGFYNSGQWDLSAFTAIKLRARAQGQNFRYKVYLKHHGESSGAGGSYESYFEMPTPETPNSDFTEVTLPLSSFAYYYRGQLDPTAPPLDATDVTLFGLQIYGGVYEDYKQSGASSLEVDWITAA